MPVSLATQSDTAPVDAERWLADSQTLQNTTGVRTWPADLGEPPAFQAPYPAFYSYAGDTPGEAVLRQFDLFEQLAPTFRAAYESFPFSWVYVTTAQEAMMIYPYVPIDEAVNNGMPTETPFYQAADVAARQVGWTAPYLDLVGAGMMVTASYPVYQDDTLLAVTSRDITLDQLTNAVLAHLTIDGGSALVVDADGLAIDATDPTLAAEIDSTNASAGAAVLYFRTDAGRQALAAPDAKISQSAPTNAVVEQVLAAAAQSDSDVVRLEIDGERILGGVIDRTGWLVLLRLPSAA